ncbi:MAG: 2'-5' RNA ligase family protein [Reyranellales bacterium]
MNELFAAPLETFRPISAAGRDRLSMLTARRAQKRHDQIGPARSQPTDRLFLAVLPDPETASRIADVAQRLRVGHGLTGKPLEPEHLHVTLCHIGDGVGLPSEVVASVAERAAGVVMPPFRIAFDRVMSFRNGAFVLSGDESVIGLEVLQQRLSDALDGRPQRARPFTPHLTLLRDGHRVPEHSIEPIGWTVCEVVLVHSLLGRTMHRHLARLPLA